MLLLVESPEAHAFVEGVVTKYQAAAPGTLLSRSVEASLSKSVELLTKAGAELLSGGSKQEGKECRQAGQAAAAGGSGPWGGGVE
jgi:hypothetical protein